MSLITRNAKGYRSMTVQLLLAGPNNRQGHHCPTIPCGPLFKQIKLFFSGILTVYFNRNYTWSYENRVSKHFVIFSTSPVNSLFTVLFAYVFFFLLVLWLGICVEVDVDRITILPPPLPRSLLFSLPTILCLTQVTVIRNQCAPKTGFGAV